jgi:hypothetical protein
VPGSILPGARIYVHSFTSWRLVLQSVCGQRQRVLALEAASQPPKAPLAQPSCYISEICLAATSASGTTRFGGRAK